VWAPLAAVVEFQSNITAPLLNRATGVPSRSSSIRAIPDSSDASIAIGTASIASLGALSRTLGGVMSFVTTIVRREETVRPSRRIARACTLCGPFGVPFVFHVVVHRRAAHDFALTSSIAISTRTTSSPRAEPTMRTAPAAGEGAVTVTAMRDCADANDASRTEPIKHAEMNKAVLHKAVTSNAEAHVSAYEQPFLR
jgi:hypothetical protein